MSGANVMHHQPKLVLGLAKNYRSSPPKAERSEVQILSVRHNSFYIHIAIIFDFSLFSEKCSFDPDLTVKGQINT